MHSLAALFVSLVIAANAVFPNSNIPQVLGVKIAEAGLETETSETFDKTSTRPATLRFFEKGKNTLRIGGDASKSAEHKEKREEFKKKLGELKDEKKKEKLEKMDANFAKINTKATEHWQKVLDRLSKILAKIKIRTDEAAAKGKDVTSVLSAISTAETKIADAQAAVTSQSQQTYTVSIDTEKNLGQSVSTTVQVLRSDLKAIEAKVKDAREALRAAYKALKAVIGETEGTATPSGTPAGP